MIRIEVEDEAVIAALRRLQAAVAAPRPAMEAIGEALAETTRRRFAAGRGPDGRPWVPNSPVTVARFLSRFRGARRRDGVLTRRGARLAASKRPLIGETKRLSSEIHHAASAREVEIGSSLVYSAVQQFGARKGAFGRTRHGAPIPWGDIPPRPFLGLDDRDRTLVVRIIARHIAAAAR
ncbi:MAG: virion morphogenesis protein [Rhodothalassiaceae bacterium]|nr:MAG: virion morphogenesis protein [Rhodothalassiaceae bacterium]